MKTKFYHLYADAIDKDGEKHTVTVVGKFTQDYIKKPIEKDTLIIMTSGSNVNGKVTFNKRTLHRTLTVGVAICSPTDEFDEEIGINVAKKRIEEGRDSGTIETENVTMLTEDLIYCELFGKLSYICNNIEKYISKKQNKGI